MDKLTVYSLCHFDQDWQMAAQVEAVLVTVLGKRRIIQVVQPVQLQGLQEEME